MKKLISYIFLLFFSLSVISTDTIKVLYFNIWSGLTYKGVFYTKSYEKKGDHELRKNLLLSGLKGLSPHIIGLGEVNPVFKYANEIGENLGYSNVAHISKGGFRVGPVGFPLNLREGSAVFAKENLVLELIGRKRLQGSIVEKWISLGSASQVIASKINIKGKTVYVFITHWNESLFDTKSNLQSMVTKYTSKEITENELMKQMKASIKGEKIRYKEAVDTLDYINEIAKRAPVILMGTLNCLPDSKEIKLFKDAGFRDAWLTSGGYTWDEVYNSNITDLEKTDLYKLGKSRDRVDYILVRGADIRPVSSRIVFSGSTYNTHVSDHNGILAEIYVRTP